MHDVLRHLGADLARQFDKARVLGVLARFTGAIELIHRNTMPTQTGARIERHKPKRLRLSRIDDLPDIDPHRAINEFKFVHQRDVYASENVPRRLGRCTYPTEKTRNTLSMARW